VATEKAGGALDEIEAKRVLFYTGGIATLTMVINATTCPKLVRALGIVQGHGAQKTMLLSLHEQMVCLASEEASSNFVVNKLITDILQGIERRIVGVDLLPDEKSDDDEESTAENFESEMSSTLQVPTRKEPRHLRGAADGGPDAGKEDADDITTVRTISKEHSKGVVMRSMPSVGSTSLLSDRITSHASASMGFYNWLGVKFEPTVPGATVATEFEVTEQWRNMVPKDRLRLLDLPPVLALPDKQEAQMKDTVIHLTATPGKVQMVNGSFFALLRAQYWEQINDGKFISGGGNPEILLSSIVYAEQHAEEGLKDLDYILDELGIVFQAPDSNTFAEAPKRIPRANSRRSSRGSRAGEGGRSHGLEGNSPKSPVSQTNSQTQTRRNRRPSMRSVEDVKQAVMLSKLLVNSAEVGSFSSSFASRIVRHAGFTALAYVSIILNVIVLFSQEEKRKDEGETALHWKVSEAILTIFLVLECLLKFCAYRGKYIRDPWNVVDILLAVARTVFLVLEVVTWILDMEYSANYSSEITLLRLYRFFQVLKETRVFRLQKLFYILRSRFVGGKDVSVDNVRNLRPLIVLSALVTAHVKSQELFESYFGDVESKAHSNEQARVILQSRTIVNKALVLIGTAVTKVEKPLLKRLAVLREGSKVTARISKLVLDAEHVGVVSGREAEWILEPLKHKTKMWNELMQQAEMGIVLDDGEGSVEWHVQRAKTLSEITLSSHIVEAADEELEARPQLSIKSTKSSKASDTERRGMWALAQEDTEEPQEGDTRGPTPESQETIVSSATLIGRATEPQDGSEELPAVVALTRQAMVSGLASPQVSTLPFVPDTPLGEPPLMAAGH